MTTDEAETSNDDTTLERLESRLVELADEIGAVLADSPSADREALHDYAVSLVRERLPAVEVHGGGASEEGVAAGDASSGKKEDAGSGAASLVGYGVLFIPVGLLLVPIFGLPGFMLLLVGVVMMTLGFVSGLAGKLRGKP